jgi:hypothetical protein
MSMIRKFTTCMVFLSSVLLLNSCNDDEASSPPKTSFTVDKTVGDANSTEFTFVVNKVNATSISLLPYGTENPSFGGVLISSFKDDGTATVKFTYDKVGTYNAVVVTNNHTGDGNAKNTYSDPIAITIGSNLAELKDFAFEKSTKTDVSGNTITVTVPYKTNLTALKANFTASPFSKVTVGGTEQKSGSTANNFTTPVTYTVTSNRGTTATYSVVVMVTPADPDNTVKSVSGKETSKAAKNKVIPGDVNNTTGKIVLYDVYGTPATSFDSVRFAYALTSKFSIAKYNGKLLKQDSLLNLTASKHIVVFNQDSVQAPYDIYAVAAPKLQLSFLGLTPNVAGTTTDFAIAATVLKGTNITALVPTSTFTLPSGVTVLSTKAADAPFISGVTTVDFTKPVVFELTVHDTNLGFDYKVKYTVTVTVIP